MCVCVLYGYSVKLQHTEECWAEGILAFLGRNVSVECSVSVVVTEPFKLHLCDIICNQLTFVTATVWSMSWCISRDAVGTSWASTSKRSNRPIPFTSAVFHPSVLLGTWARGKKTDVNKPSAKWEVYTAVIPKLMSSEMLYRELQTFWRNVVPSFAGSSALFYLFTLKT